MARNTNEDYLGYQATYCESCGQLFSASDRIESNVTEPVHRVELIDAIGLMDEVGETVAIEQDTCECSGQIVDRYYVYPAGNVPDVEYEVDEDEVAGRDPVEDALIGFDTDPDPADFQEVREIPWLAEGTDE